MIFFVIVCYCFLLLFVIVFYIDYFYCFVNDVVVVKMFARVAI